MIDFWNIPLDLLENERHDAGVCNWQVMSPDSKRKRVVLGADRSLEV